MRYAVSILFMFFVSICPAQKKSASPADLKDLPGNWKGQLVYTDYKDDKTQVTLQTTIHISSSGDSMLMDFTYTEPNGKKVTDKGSIRIYNDGKNIYYDGNEYDIIRVARNGARLTIIAEREGNDNDREADIRDTFIIGPDNINFKKEVKYVNEAKYFVRNNIMMVKENSN